MDFFGPTRTLSLGRKQYALVIIDDYSRFIWTLFLAHKDDIFHTFVKICKKIQNEKDFRIACIRSDNEREFRNESFNSYCDEHDREDSFSVPRTPQQNSVVERKNRTLEELLEQC